MAQTQILLPPFSLLTLHNVGEVAALAKASGILPQQFVVPEADRPTIAHDGFLAELDLPLFDLSLYESIHDEEQRKKMVEELSDACKKWGFFRLVNHGLSPEHLKRMDLFGRSFFALPAEAKERGVGYKGKFDHSASKHGWFEAINLGLPVSETQAQFFDPVWPEGNQEFSECFKNYEDAMGDIALKLLEVLTEGLGIDSTTFSQHCTKETAGIRYNYYPPCPEPSKAMGLGAHTDPNALTILYQDEVGGLQLRGEDGNWLAIKPQTGSLIVNIGDIMKVWSNCKYRAAEHKAVLNGKEARLSLGYFLGPKTDIAVETVKELVDDDHPVQYKPFTWGDYRRQRIMIKGGARALDIFAGINNAQQEQT